MANQGWGPRSGEPRLPKTRPTCLNAMSNHCYYYSEVFYSSPFNITQKHYILEVQKTIFYTKKISHK